MYGESGNVDPILRLAMLWARIRHCSSAMGFLVNNFGIYMPWRNTSNWVVVRFLARIPVSWSVGS
jgi:hypothetical protein